MGKVECVHVPRPDKYIFFQMCLLSATTTGNPDKQSDGAQGNGSAVDFYRRDSLDIRSCKRRRRSFNVRGGGEERAGVKLGV